MIVKTIVNEKLSIWFDPDPSVAKIILAKIIQAAVIECCSGLEKMSEEKERLN